MEIIHLHHPYHLTSINKEEKVLALGFFDGVHRGHQEVIQTARDIAQQRGVKLALMTFDRHPSILYKKFDDLSLRYLTDNCRKKELLEHLGVDILYQVNFTSSFASLSPQEFVDLYVANLGVVAVVAGFDYTYGKKEIASMKQLPTYAKGRFDVYSVAPFLYKGQKISSTNLRHEIEQGALEDANVMLGYAYATGGFVVRGDARGRTLGYPTANVHIETPICIPQKGIYAVKMRVAGKNYDGMASVGYNITFEKRSTLSIEIHLFDFNQEIYGENVLIHWLAYLRDEVKFSSIDQFMAQLQEDETKSRLILRDTTIKMI